MSKTEKAKVSGWRIENAAGQLLTLLEDVTMTDSHQSNQKITKAIMTSMACYFSSDSQTIQYTVYRRWPKKEEASKHIFVMAEMLLNFRVYITFQVNILILISFLENFTIRYRQGTLQAACPEASLPRNPGCATLELFVFSCIGRLR